MKKRNVPAGIFVIGIIVLVGAAFLWTSFHPITHESGIVGKIILGPTCPVEYNNSATQCYKPYQATVVVRPLNDFGYVEFSSDENGTFRVFLDPGTYTLTPLNPNSLLPRASIQTVTVEPNQFTNVLIAYDTGIR